jgi:hypothetical protein
MKTRQQYLNHECTHREYYAQFVTNATRSAVLERIGIDRLLSNAEDLNRIPLSTWDGLMIFYRLTTEKLRLAGDFQSMAGKVCIAKEAARQLIEEAKAGNPNPANR